MYSFLTISFLCASGVLAGIDLRRVSFKALVGDPSIEKRQYETCGEGYTCAQACGPGNIQCSVSGYCYNPSDGEVCCSDGSYCEDGYYCTDVGCCPQGSSLAECGANQQLSTLPPVYSSSAAYGASSYYYYSSSAYYSNYYSSYIYYSSSSDYYGGGSYPTYSSSYAPYTTRNPNPGHPGRPGRPGQNTPTQSNNNPASSSSVPPPPAGGGGAIPTLAAEAFALAVAGVGALML